MWNTNVSPLLKSPKRSTSRSLGAYFRPPFPQVLLNKQRKIIWPGGDTDRPKGFQMSTWLKVQYHLKNICHKKQWMWFFFKCFLIRSDFCYMEYKEFITQFPITIHLNSWFITDSHNTSGAFCVREANHAGWDLQGRIHTERSIN